MNVSAAVFDEPESNATPIPGLVEALQAGGVFYRLSGADKEGALRAVVEHMRLPEEVDREFLLRVLLAREALQSTGVGDGVAIPHVRNPIVLHVSRPMITLCFLERPIDFGALDGKPVHVLFSLISPTVRAHLRLLSRLSFALHDPAFKDAVTRQASREEILREAQRVEDGLGPVATPAAGVLLGQPVRSLRVAWDVPYGAFFVQIDPLSAFFLLPIFGLSALAAVYGAEYMRAYRDEESAGSSWFFFDLLLASMAMVVVARNAVLFLVAWEVMALTSFFLVTFQDEEESVRSAGWTYRVASHLGTACLLALFILLGRCTGSLDFARFTAASGVGLLFILAMVGFGSKAGFMPFHVWLPEAHPAAPSHVSAVMSGVMIKTGIYGLVRALTFLGPLPAWAGWLLIGVGVTSGVLGVLFALAQHDLKRLLAYSSVENMAIIALGRGLGLIGLRVGSTSLAVLGSAGGLLHVFN